MSLPISLPITVARDGADDCPSGPLLTLREVLGVKGRATQQIMGKGSRCQKPQASPIASFFLPSLAVYVGLATVAATLVVPV